jgi:hypothetical protein
MIKSTRSQPHKEDIMFWFYYACCTIVGGALVARLSLKIVKYPNRYPKWIQFLCFPMSSVDGETVDKVLRAKSERPFLLTTLDIGVWDPQEDAEETREKRAMYIFLTMFFLPLRLFFLLCAIVVIGVVLFIYLIVKVVSYGIKKCKYCVDV